MTICRKMWSVRDERHGCGRKNGHRGGHKCLVCGTRKPQLVKK